jgi:hypothetical protein
MPLACYAEDGVHSSVGGTTANRQLVEVAITRMPRFVLIGDRLLQVIIPRILSGVGIVGADEGDGGRDIVDDLIAHVTS